MNISGVLWVMLPFRGAGGLEEKFLTRYTMHSLQFRPQHDPRSGDTTPCKVTAVILHGVVSPFGVTLHRVAGISRFSFQSDSGNCWPLFGLLI